MKRIAVIEQYAGVGDCVHIEPVLRHILANGYDEINIFYRSDAVGMYKEYPNVHDHPLGAKQLILSLCREGAVHVAVGDTEHHIPGLHRVFQYAQKICPALNVPMMDGEYPPTPCITVTDQEREWGKIYFRANNGQMKVLFQVDSYRSSKSLPVEKARDILESLTDKGICTSLICHDYMKYHTNGSVRHVRGLTIRQLMAVASGADSTLAMDSAPGWISLAVGTPTIMLFGATSPQFYAYNSSRLKVLVNTTMGCVYCNEKACDHRTCLDAIDTDWILAAIEGKEYKQKEQWPPKDLKYPSALQRRIIGGQS